MVREYNPHHRFNSYVADAWQRASKEAAEDGILFNPWHYDDKNYPKSSMPAQVASKCVLLEGGESFDRFHLAIMKAFFEDNMDISDEKILISLAHDVDINMDTFTTHLTNHSIVDRVLSEYREAIENYPGMGVPLAIFGRRYHIPGAVPIQIYKRVIDLLKKMKN